jgi:excisionase family DNA binding protein
MPLTVDLFLGINPHMKLLNTTQAAERLGVSVRRVRALIAEGSLRAHQLGREYAIEEGALAHVTVYRKPGRPSAKKGTKKAK